MGVLRKFRRPLHRTKFFAQIVADFVKPCNGVAKYDYLQIVSNIKFCQQKIAILLCNSELLGWSNLKPLIVVMPQ